MSDTPISNVGSSNAEIADESIQHAWDRYAMPDHSIDPEWHHSPLAVSTNVTITARTFDSRPENDSATVLDNATAGPDSIDVSAAHVDGSDVWRMSR